MVKERTRIDTASRPKMAQRAAFNMREILLTGAGTGSTASSAKGAIEV